MTDLEQYDELYDNVEANLFESVPDGKYQVFVEKIAVNETKKQPVRPMLTWQFNIMAGAHEGRVIFKNSVISVKSREDTERSLSFIKTDLSVCGMKLKKFSDLQQHLELLLNMQLEVKVVNKVVNKEDVQNVYIQRKLEGIELDAKTKDSIPF